MNEEVTSIVEEKLWFFRDEPMDNARLERLKFHLDTGDYFPMLATILGFVQETVQEYGRTNSGEEVPVESDLLKEVRNELMYLHKNYRIVPISDEETGQK